MASSRDDTSISDKFVWHESTTPAGWMGYICVDDVEAAAESALKAGGKTIMGPTEVPGVRTEK